MRHRQLTALVTAGLLALPLVACGASTTGADAKRSTPTPSASTVAPVPSSTTLTAAVSSGFELERDGFSFENYSNEKRPVNLTATAMAELFGKETCARTGSDGCTLTAPAAAWLAINNLQMNGGHCFGMAAAAALLFTGAVKASTYGASTTHALKDDGKVQELIARLFVTQATDPERATARKVTVTEAISTLRQAWAADILPLLAIRTPDGKGGHAVTPVALRPLAGGTVAMDVYDNNFPGEQRTITLDPAANTWKYVTATDPNQALTQYGGGAANPMQLWSTPASLTKQDCPFCRDNDSPYVYVLLNPESAEAGVTLAVTDLAGKTLPGVVQVPWLSDDGDDDADLLVQVPKTAAFRVQMMGTAVKAGETAAGQLNVVGTGWTDSVTSVQLSPGESDSITVDPTSGDFSYTSADAESPYLGNTIDEGDRSYSFLFQGAAIDADGGSYQVSVDRAKHTERIASVGTGPSTMAFAFSRIDGTATRDFRTPRLSIDSGEALIADYGTWKGDGRPLTVGIGSAGNGAVSKVVELQDQ